MPITCLNCATEFEGKFCPNCAQRASTERFTFKHLFTRDFLADTFNFDRGFLHTCLSMFYRPGYAVADYLKGQRKEYFNFIGFLLILLAVEALLWQFAYNSPAEMMQRQLNKQLLEQNPELAFTLSVADIEVVLQNQKFLFLFAIPIAAFVSWLVLKRLKYNYLEHIIAVCFMLAMNTILGVSVGLFGLLPLEFDLYSNIYMGLSFVIIFFDFLFFWQLSKSVEYTIFGRIWRVLVAGFAVLMIVGLSLNLAMGIVAGRRMSMEKKEAAKFEQQVTTPASDSIAPGN